MNDLQATIDLLLQLQEDIRLNSFEDMALAVLSIKQLTQVTDDLRRKLKLAKTDMTLDEVVHLSKLIKDAGILNDSPMQPKRYTSGITWDKDIR